MDYNELNDAFLYDPLTGALTNKITRGGRAQKGATAGSKDATGYLLVRLKSTQYKAHRIAWLLSHGAINPDLHIDHVDGDPANNRLNNLRLVTQQHNNWNRKKAVGKWPLGVNWDKGENKFRARITVNLKTVHLGYFDCPDEAHQAYLAAKKIHHVIA